MVIKLIFCTIFHDHAKCCLFVCSTEKSILYKLLNKITCGRLIHLVLVFFSDTQRVLPGNIFVVFKCEVS